MRHRTQPWAAMRFIRQAKKFSSRLSKLRRWLTLLARILAIVSLVFLLARPFTSQNGSLFSLSPDEPEISLLVLDRSASMERTSLGSNLSLREQALRQFATLSETWASAKLFCIETVLGEPILLDDPDTLLKEEMKDFFGPTDSEANLPRTIRGAFEWLREAKVKSAEIFVASDFQSSSWKISENAEVLKEISEEIKDREGRWKIRFLKLEPSRNLNRSIRAQTVRETEKSILPTLAIRSNQNSDESLSLEVSVNGSPSVIDFNFTAPQSVWTPRISLSPETQTGWLRISLPRDACSPDNAHYLTYGQTDREKIFAFASDPEVGRILKATASLKGDEVFSLSLNEAIEATDRTGNLILFQGKFGDDLAGKYEEVVRGGATLVLFPSEFEQAEWSGLQHWDALETIEEKSAFSVTQWNPDSGVLADTSGGQNLPLPLLGILKRKVPMLGQTLAYHADGKAFLTRRVLGKGIIYSFSTLPMPSWSSLAEGYVLVPSILRVMEEARTSLARTGLDCGGPESKETNKATPITGKPGDQPSLRAGIYEVNGRLLAFNRPTRESSLETIAVGELDELIGSSHISWIGAEASTSIFKQAEIWRFFLVLMTVLLLAESFLGLPARKSKRAKSHAT